MSWLPTAGAVASLVSAIGVVLWIIVTFMAQRQIREALERQSETLDTLKREDRSISSIAQSVSLIQRAQCASPQVLQDQELASALGCQPPTPSGGATATRVLPNYGYFGPFGTAPVAANVGMPAFYP